MSDTRMSLRITVRLPLEATRWYDLADCWSPEAAAEIVRMILLHGSDRGDKRLLLEWSRIPKPEAQS